MNESEFSKYVALDAEITRTRTSGRDNIPEPTQVAITDINGNVLFNEYFNINYTPKTPMSRERKEKLRKNAKRTYDKARNEVLSVLRGKIVVGHDLFNDFKALDINPVRDGLAGVLDSAKLPIFKTIKPVTFEPRALKNLTREFLHRNIQTSTMHNAVEDSKASANLIRTTFPYLDAPLPVTRDMMAKSKVVTDYGRRMGINREAVNMPNLFEFKSPVKSADNYLKEMEGLNIRRTKENYLREMEGLHPTNHFAELVNNMAGGSVRHRRGISHRKTRYRGSMGHRKTRRLRR